MKPLSERQLAFAKTFLINGLLRPVVKRIFQAALALEERWFAATPGPTRDLPPGKATAVIKTFERPRRCAALIASIRRRYPDLPIIVTIRVTRRIIGDAVSSGCRSTAASVPVVMPGSLRSRLNISSASTMTSCSIGGRNWRARWTS